MNRLLRGFRAATAKVCVLVLSAFSDVGQSYAADANNGKYVLLSIVGYNYTDRYIDSFTVNGAGGGNIFVSSASSGGGGIECCVRLNTSNARFSRVRVRWQAGGCTYLTRSRISGETFENIFPYFREADVKINVRAKANPGQLEIHFYKDGSVVAELTERLSQPHVALDEGRAEKSSYPRCPNDKKPE